MKIGNKEEWVEESATEESQYKEQTIKGNQAWRKSRLSGSLVTYQCGEEVMGRC